MMLVMSAISAGYLQLLEHTVMGNQPSLSVTCTRGRHKDLLVERDGQCSRFGLLGYTQSDLLASLLALAEQTGPSSLVAELEEAASSGL